MSISRVYGAGWGVGEKLTSAQANGIDTSLTYALDKRAGQTDTLESAVVAAGAGRITPTVEVGADADTTYAVADGISIIRIPTTLTANRTYVLSDTGAQNGDTVFIFMETPNTRRVRINNSGGTQLHAFGSVAAATSTEGYEATFVWKTGVGWQRAAGRPSTLAVEVFTATTTWQCPRGTKAALVWLYGGGAGGAGGQTSNTSISRHYAGGGGGGAAIAAFVPVATTPGQVYDVTVGAGGAGGGTGLVGADGGDSKFTLSGVDLAVSRGAQGGQASTLTYGDQSTSFPDVLARGGMPRRSPPMVVLGSVATGQTEIRYTETGINPAAIAHPLFDGQGGFGGGRAAATAGAPQAGSPYAGGTGGTRGADGADLVTVGGGGGGGGGAGPGGAGGAGGNGGNGVSPGSGVAGTDGQAASANTGAGGGGGGGGGAGSVSGASGGAGGNGGSGKVVLIYVIQGE